MNYTAASDCSLPPITQLSLEGENCGYEDIDLLRESVGHGHSLGLGRLANNPIRQTPVQLAMASGGVLVLQPGYRMLRVDAEAKDAVPVIHQLRRGIHDGSDFDKPLHFEGEDSFPRDLLGLSRCLLRLYDAAVPARIRSCHSQWRKITPESSCGMDTRVFTK